jgi:hypothetical protein
MTSIGEAPFYDTILLPPRHSGHAWWLRLEDESLGYYWFIGTKAFREMFDLTMGMIDSIFDIVNPSYPVEKSQIADFYNTRVKYENKRNNVLFAWMATNCWARNHRKNYVQELMNYTTVHSYGGCLHNIDIPDEILEKYGAKKGDSYWHASMDDIKRETISPYKFVLAFENSDCESYVTEKVYDALLADAIPIYMGASDIDNFVPPNSIIKVTDFNSTSLLVDYVKTVAENQTLYESYFAWRKDKTHKNFCKKCVPDETAICQFLDRVKWV